MGLTLTTDGKGTKIYRHDKISAAGNSYTTYSASVSSKNTDGSWTNGFLDVSFRKGIDVANKAVIKIKSAFPVVREYNGKTYVSWMIMDFDKISDGDAPANANKPTGLDAINADFMVIPDDISDSLPFV